MLAYVSNAGWLDANATDGLRRCLSEEFASIHVFHLRGNARTSGEQRRKEKDSVFGQGTRTPVAITVLVKNPNAVARGRIFFHDIGDYLTRDEKLAIVTRFRSVGGIDRANGWRAITPDQHGDWLKQRNSNFETFIALGDKKGIETKLFANFSLGVVTNRDAWAYNAGRKAAATNMHSMIDFYNAELDRFDAIHKQSDRKERDAALDKFINTDPSKISWTRALKSDLVKGKHFTFNGDCLTPSLYRPFTRQWLYYNRAFNEMVYQMPRIFPMGDSTAENRVICTSGGGEKVPFSVLMSNALPSLHMVDIEGSQCFPRYIFDEEVSASDEDQGNLLSAGANEENHQRRRDAITDEGLTHFRTAYPGEPISKDDLFYYVYGLLHSEDYRARFADNLSKQLPRIPAVKQAVDFWTFVGAGRKLAELHCGYEQVEPYPITIAQGDLRLANISDPQSFYRVEQMKFGGKRPKLDKSTVIYNASITMTGIPLEAYDYVVNGKSALEWVMERQCIKVDRPSGIVNDANSYAVETVGDPAYPLLLFQRVITVSLETMKIVRSLPKLEFASPEVDRRKERSIDQIKSGIKAQWGDVPATSIALDIIDGIPALATSTLRVGDILRMLNMTELSGDVIAALAILAQSEFAVLRSGGEFLDRNGDRYKLSPEDFKRVLTRDTIVHPVTRLELDNASAQVIPILELATDFFRRDKK